MNKLLMALFCAALLLTSVASAQDQAQNAVPKPQELPSAPSAVQPHFPGAPAQPPQPASELSASELKDTPPTPTGVLPEAAPAPKASEAAPKSSETKPLFTPMNIPPAEPAAEKPLAPADTGEFLIGVQVDLVDLIFTATDKHGHFIKDLKKEDVRLLDEGKPPLRVEAFESESGLPLRVGLLIDASNSIRERFRFEQDAAVEFLNQVVRPKSDRAFVIGFDSVADLTQDYTENTDALARGIRVLRPGGGTALHDAVYLACEKLAKAPLQGPSRRAIILLSDGDDNQSRHTREEAVEAALRAGVIVYIIDTDPTDGNKKGEKILMRYAEATGGRVFFPLRIEEVASAFTQIQDELRSQYVVAYKPQNFEADGRYHAISIDIPSRSNVKLRARKGYYAPKGSQ